MPNDAKLGLVFGVGLVIAIAVLFRREMAVPEPGRPTPAIAPVLPGSPARPGGAEHGHRPPPPGTPVTHRTIREDDPTP
jgi:hypothetical protein